MTIEDNSERPLVGRASELARAEPADPEPARPEPTRPELDSPQLTERWREIEETGRAAAKLAGDLTPKQLWWRPASDRWSVGGCLEHLVRTGEEYLVVLDEAIEEGRTAGRTAEGPFRHNLAGRWVARMLEPPPRLKLPAPKRIRPRPPSTGETMEPGERAAGSSPLPGFLALRSHLARRLEAADGLDLGRIRVPSPFVPLLRFDLDSAFHVIAAHERRHLWQARQVTEADHFPSEEIS